MFPPATQRTNENQNNYGGEEQLRSNIGSDQGGRHREGTSSTLQEKRDQLPKGGIEIKQ